MTQIKHIVALILAGALLAPLSVTAQGRDLPPVPATGAYVSEINADWLKISVNTGGLTMNDVRTFEGV